MRRSIPVVCVLFACHWPDRGQGNFPPAGECRGSETPQTCHVIRCDPHSSCNLTGPQGTYLEGPGLERRRFTRTDGADSTVFPPPPGTLLAGAVICGNEERPRIRIKGCAPGEGASLCTVEVEQGSGICDDPDRAKKIDRGILLVRGYWNGAGTWVADPASFTMSCNHDGASGEFQPDTGDGAVSKCATAFSPVSKREEFLACIRMERADYCGDGQPHTVNGTEIFAAEPAENPDCKDGRCFEASWSKDGAVCMARTRWIGTGMGADRCKDQFVPSPSPGIVCRKGVGDGILRNRSQLQECGVFGSRPCPATQETEAMCHP